MIHGVVAFGGGILMAAVAFALAPEAIEVLSPLGLVITFVAGGAGFCGVDAWLSRRGGSVAQFMAMLMDFIPEAVSLGAVFGHDRRLGMLLAAFIGAQNLPEGFNAYRELRDAKERARRVLWILFLISFLGPAAACAGYFLLQDQDRLVAGLMSFASGGILYLIFQDIAPKSRMRSHWVPPLGAVLGFALGMLGHKLLG